MIIRHKTTGREIEVSDADAASFGIEVQPKEKSVTQKASDVVRGLGLGLLPNTAANVMDVGGALISGNKIDPSNYQNPFRTQEQLGQQYPKLGQDVGFGEKMTQGYGQLGRDVAGAASWAVPETKLLKGVNFLSKAGNLALRGGVQGTGYGVSQDFSLPGIAGTALGGSILGPLLGGLKSGMLTKGGAARATDVGATKATSAGANMPWDDLVAQAKEAVFKRFGDTKLVKSVINKVIAPRTPSTLNNLVQQTPEQLLKMRRELLATYGRGMFEPASNQPLSKLEEKVAGIIRTTISSNLHKLAPETITPDKLYSIYANKLFGGSVPTMIAKYIGIPAAIALFGKQLGGAAKTTVNVVGQ